MTAARWLRIRWWALFAVLAVIVVVAVLLRDRDPAARTSASDSSVLVLTWGPSLCQVESSVRGCRNGNVGRMGPSLVLHGLWPQPSSEQYCGMPKDSAGGRKAPDLPDNLRARLQTMMSDAATMAPHEWYAHGTCSGVSPAEYFSIAAALTDQAFVVLGPVFTGARGQRLTARAVRQAVDAAFGRGAGERVSLSCRRPASGGDIVYEVRLSMPTVTALASDKTPLLSDALSRGPAVAPGCGQGRVP